MKNWIITFNDGSTARYWNMTALAALAMARTDWYPVKTAVRLGKAWTRIDRTFD